MEPIASGSHATHDTVQTPMVSTDGEHDDALGNLSEGAVLEVVSAPGHASNPCQVDASLRKASPTGKMEEKSDDVTKVEAKRLGEKSEDTAPGVVPELLKRKFFDRVRVWDTNEMISMIEKNSQLMLETSTWRFAVCNVFQLAVLVNSDEMVGKMLRIAIREFGPHPRQLCNVFKLNGCEMSSLDTARGMGNEFIVNLLEKLYSTDERIMNRLAKSNDGSPIDFDNINYSPPGLAEKQSILALLRPILSGDFEAVFKGDSVAEDLLEERTKEALPKETVREMLISTGRNRARSTIWWGKPYGISLLSPDDDDLFVLHCIAGYDSQERLLSFSRLVLKKICGTLGPRYTTCLMHLRDHHGRTPAHVLTEGKSGVTKLIIKFVRDFLLLVKIYCEPGFNVFTVPDLAGRTCLHYAVTSAADGQLEAMAEIDGDGFKAALDTGYGRRNGRGNGPRKDTAALHLAVRHNSIKCVKILAKQGCDVNKFDRKGVGLSNSTGESLVPVSAFQMAAVEGQSEILQVLLEEGINLWDRGMINRPFERDDSSWEWRSQMPALHLAAHSGNPLAVKILLDSGKFDPLAVDEFGDTALHSVAGSELKKLDCVLQPADFVHPVYYHSAKSRNPAAFNLDLQKKSLGGIIGCMDLLMQAGLDMDQLNVHGQTPQLRSSAPDDLARWWYDKLAKQNQEVKANLVAAANAVSVTAALVATASFVGPLQPPLGLSPSTEPWLTGYGQVNHTAVQVFLFCDSLSFYLAIASIMLAIIPSLTIPKEALPLEVGIANRVVQVAVVLLFASITFVICAFSAASIAIVPKSRWHYKAFAVVSTILGALICLLALCVFLLRLARLIRPKDMWVRNLTNYVFVRSKKRKQPLLQSRSDSERHSQVDSEVQGNKKSWLQSRSEVLGGKKWRLQCCSDEHSGVDAEDRTTRSSH